MTRTPEPGIFKPAASRTEAKSDATTRTVRDILAAETAARVAKTERLRQARLALPAEDAAPKKKPARKRGASE